MPVFCCNISVLCNSCCNGNAATGKNSKLLYDVFDDLTWNFHDLWTISKYRIFILGYMRTFASHLMAQQKLKHWKYRHSLCWLASIIKSYLAGLILCMQPEHRWHKMQGQGTAHVGAEQHNKFIVKFHDYSKTFSDFPKFHDRFSMTVGTLRIKPPL